MFKNITKEASEEIFVVMYIGGVDKALNANNIKRVSIKNLVIFNTYCSTVLNAALVYFHKNAQLWHALVFLSINRAKIFRHRIQYYKFVELCNQKFHFFFL